jgi:hypothetical protein
VLIDTTVPGIHTVTYYASDEAGNTATATRTVEVVQPAVPAQTETSPVIETPPVDGDTGSGTTTPVM